MQPARAVCVCVANDRTLRSSSVTLSFADSPHKLLSLANLQMICILFLFTEWLSLRLRLCVGVGDRFAGGERPMPSYIIVIVAQAMHTLLHYVPYECYIQVLH